MALSDDWQEVKYNEIFEQETRGLIRRFDSDPGCKIEDFQAILKSLYIMEDSDIGGRGRLQDTILAATIAAYEQFIGTLTAEAK
jgi:NDP-sugar pyrophosphorylase family protein